MDEENGRSITLDRRRFIQTGLATALGGMLGGDASAASLPYRVTGYSGDEFKLGHGLRDGEFDARPKTEKRHDVVIVGAGVSGLTAAFKLRHLDTLVLDQASEIGGNSKGARRGQVEFNIGAAYFTGVDGVQGQLWDELGLTLTAMDQPNDRWLVGGKWIDHPWSDEGIGSAPPALQRKMRAMKKALVEISNSKDFPNTPYHKATPNALKLDKITFAEWLKPYAHPDLLAFIEAYCFSALGASAKTLSAYGALNFYTEFLGNIYGFPEGNWGVVKALAAPFEKAGKGRIVKGALAYRVEPAGDGVRVCYTRRGQSHAVEARRAIIATPFLVTSRLIANLSPAQRYALNLPRYASYFVANMIFDKIICFDAFDNWVPTAHVFDDYITSTWADKEKHRQLEQAGAGQVVSFFAPCRSASLGRWRMMTQKPEAIARPVVEAFAKLHPGCLAHLKEVHVTRWGHGVLINQTGMYTRWLPAVQKQHGPIYLAHSDGQALPAMESCTYEAITAAQNVLTRWKKG